jgi:hypothetical protein
MEWKLMKKKRDRLHCHGLPLQQEPLLQMHFTAQQHKQMIKPTSHYPNKEESAQTPQTLTYYRLQAH